MDTFQKQIQLELTKQQLLLEKQSQFLDAAPEGFLFARHRTRYDSYYHQRKIRDGRQWKTVQININDNPDMQDLLLRKKLAEKSVRIYEHNLPLLQKINEQYRSTDYEDITGAFPWQYDQLLKARRVREMEEWSRAPYNRCPYYPEQLTHRTAYGAYVRSKGEVVIANALYAFGIPFHAEEAFRYGDNLSKVLYPDFKILLPDYSFLFWEHWGLLDKEKYRRDNVEKLYAYNESNLVLGRNLIITNDDKDGNCHSDVVYDIIEKSILPHFEGMTLPWRSI